jgi:NAD(P)-dependent dehydrogenase (short-subunit alcohol dehydrogenase family)
MGHDTTTDEVLEGVDLTGLTALVTGASAGLGVETVRALSSHGARVVAGVRDLAKGTAALDEAGVALDEGGSEPGRCELRPLDLADLASVRAFADGVLADVGRLELLVANAGVMAAPFARTADGFELQFGTNHLGHFVLVNRLVPLLVRSAPARVVLLTSAGHRRADVDLDDPGFDRTAYDPWIAYGRSKTANVLFAVELDRRLRERGVRATAVHPGTITTELGRHLTRDALAALQTRLASSGNVYKTVAQGAATSVWAGIVADADEVGGRYCEDAQVAEVTTVDRPTGVRPYALDPATAARLWARSEELVGESFPR